MTDKKEKEGKQTLKYTYFKSSQFRVVKGDGVWGGFTPRGELVMTIFNERPAIPNKEEYEINENGEIGERVGTFTEAEGIAREVEVAISLRPETALVVARWLLNKVRQFENIAGIKLEPEEVSEQKQ